MTSGSLVISSISSFYGSCSISMVVTSINFPIYSASSQSCICSPSSSVSCCFDSSLEQVLFLFSSCLSFVLLPIFASLLFLSSSTPLLHSTSSMSPAAPILLLVASAFLSSFPLISSSLISFCFCYQSFLLFDKIYLNIVDFLCLWVQKNLPLSLYLHCIATYYCCCCCFQSCCCLQSILPSCCYTDQLMDFGGIVTVPLRVPLWPMTCPVDPWKIRPHIVVLANTMGIIWIKLFSVELDFHYLLSLGIYILQALNIVESNPQHKTGPWHFLLPKKSC